MRFGEGRTDIEIVGHLLCGGVVPDVESEVYESLAEKEVAFAQEQRVKSLLAIKE